MYSHTPQGYICPICLGVEGVENKDTLICQSDVVFKDNLVTAFISSFFIENNPGHIIIVPNKHFENLYDISQEYSARILEVAQKVAIAMKKAYQCDGITTLQNNEPAGDQHAFHFHFHVFPRYENDELHKYMNEKKNTTAEQRKSFAEKIKSILN